MRLRKCVLQPVLATCVLALALACSAAPEGSAQPAVALQGSGGINRAEHQQKPSLLVVSTNDPLCSVERAVDMATAWGSELHFAGEAGHINVASGHGPWPEGLLMFTRLMQRLKA